MEGCRPLRGLNAFFNPKPGACAPGFMQTPASQVKSKTPGSQVKSKTPASQVKAKTLLRRLKPEHLLRRLNPCDVAHPDGNVLQLALFP
jgi:hypothetical protein